MTNYLDLFNKLQEELHNKTQEPLTAESKVLFVDGLNHFIRSFSANPSLNSDGVHVGGLYGFLTSLTSIINIHKPTRCVIVFDGKGGSQRRRKLYSGYKDNKKPSSKPRRAIGFENIVDEQQSMKWQLMRLIAYLETLPVTIITLDNVEADDVIAYLATQVCKQEVVIASSDKDYLQLINDRITVWSPTKKKLYDKSSFKEEYNLEPDNYILYKSLLGDSSDNIKGLNGIGDKTLQKLLPVLFDSTETISLDMLFEHCKDKDDKVSQQITKEQETIKLNHILMQLNDVDISGHSKISAINNYERNIDRLNQVEFIKLTIEDNLQIPYIQTWIRNSFGVLDNYSSR